MRGRDTIQISDYPLGGQLLLWATRHWVRAYRRGSMVPACVWQSFAAADLGRAYAELCRLLRIIAFRELDLRAISSPSAGRLSRVEQSFMRNFERVERSGYAADIGLLGAPATPAIAREVLASSVAIVTDMSDRGHRVARSAAERTGDADTKTRSTELASVH